MMQKTLAEEIYYCTHCGSANKKSAVECCECEKKITTKYRPFYDFLKKHTKEEATGTAVDTVFGFVQNFLLSHVYGIVLSVTIVAAGVATVQGFAPHIKEVTEPAVRTVVTNDSTEQEQDKPEEIREFTEDDEYYLLYLMSNYDPFADDIRTSERYWSEGHEYIDSPQEIFAQSNIEGYNFGGVHELIENPVNIGFDPVYLDNGETADLTEARYVDYNTLVTDGNFASDVAKKLDDAGYRVCECNYVLRIADVDDYNDDTNTGTVYRELVYRVVFVADGDDWYIADDRLIKRLNV